MWAMGRPLSAHQRLKAACTAARSFLEDSVRLEITAFIEEGAISTRKPAL